MRSAAQTGPSSSSRRRGRVEEGAGPGRLDAEHRGYASSNAAGQFVIGRCCQPRTVGCGG
ncbi:hypothetical protein HBB16_18195 [Pseudonocardia sp. MCCB 268]|nr:hypothetical protein [Pseudonocardia cytotoxica]